MAEAERLGRFVIRDGRMVRAPKEEADGIPEGKAALGRLWRDLVAEEYSGIMQPMMTHKRLHMLGQIARLSGGYPQAGKILSDTIPRWEEFTAKVALEAGLARVPRMPSEAFLLAHLTQAMNLPANDPEPLRDALEEATTATYRPGGLSDEDRAALLREIEEAED